MFLSTFLFIAVLLESKRKVAGDDFIFTLITGSLHILSSIILLVFISKFENKFKIGLITYQVIVVFYFLVVSETSNIIAISIPVFLAICLTVIIELLYNQTKESKININEVIDNIGE